MKDKFIIIQSLTSLRFFAAFGVFLHHLGILNQSKIPMVQEFAKYFFNGYTGVTFFYVLSGFIINYSFKRHIEGGRFDYKDFIVFRVCRLFPVHLLALFIVLSIFGYFINFYAVDKLALLSNIFLVNSFIPDTAYYFSFNPVSWSISCELFFYIAFCFLVRFSTHKLLLLLLVIQVFNVYYLFNPPEFVSGHWIFYVNPLFRVCDFIIGMLLCRFFLQTNFSPSKKLGSAMEILSLFFVALTMYISTNYIEDMNIRYDFLFIPCMTFLVMAFSFNSGVVSKLLSNKILILLGEASFSFYMLHWMVIAKLTEVMNPSANNVKELLIYITIAFCISLVSSIVVFKYYEKPINTFIRNTWVKYRYRGNGGRIKPESLSQ
ncbi:acyltransferase family protein [Hafnia paralvei]|uniref:acyltransferase family protein n=1 Tax=Hafnia paralvei TaxID=546367 RepID=UPI001034E1B3|nr:acyltransferase [Hafnia paralvei]TBL62447.1 acyltransferase [Hafnia paralvei]